MKKKSQNLMTDAGGVKFSENKKYGIIAESWYGSLQTKKIVYNFSPETKFVFMVRNPVERCYSEYKYTYAYRGLRGADEKEYYRYNHQIGFKRYISRHIGRPFNCEKKYDKVLQIYKLRAGKNIKIILLEDLKNDPEKIYKELIEFLEIKEDKELNYKVKANEGKFVPKNRLAGIVYGSFRTRFLQKILCRKYALHCKNKIFSVLFTTIFSMCEKLLKQDDDETKIDGETYKKLKEYYRKDVKELGKILNRDLETVWYS